MTGGPESEGSVTRWIDGMRDGDREALERVWERFFEKLSGLARRRLNVGGRAAGMADEEDVAMSAMISLWDRASGGQLPDLKGRDELWRLMVVITARKVVSQLKWEGRKKRGGGRKVDQGALGAGGEVDDNALAAFVGSEPTPEFAALVAEETNRRINTLPDATLRQVALLRMEGYTNQEIAQRLGCITRTVERKLELIRNIWSGGERQDPT